MISVVVICHNYGKYLDKCVSSIIKKDSKFLKEIIILDDNSEDNTQIVAKKLKKRFKKVFIYKRKFNSLSKSTNYAISKASGQWISKVDADDYVSNSFISDFVKKIKTKSQIDYICTDIICFDNRKKIEYRIKQNFLIKKSIFKYPLGSGSLFKKKLWQSVGGFDESLFYQDDLDFWLKIKKVSKIAYLNKANYFYRKHDSNMSKNLIAKYISKFYVLFKNFI